MKKSEFLHRIDKGVFILDGATGTELSARGMPAGVCPEEWILNNFSVMGALQREYREAGSNALLVPSFGANRIKLAEYGLEKNVRELNIELVKKSREHGGGIVLLGDMAPTGRFIEPLGDLPLEEAIGAYSEQAAALVEGGVDGFIIETIMDLQEARAALIAIRETCDLPVIVSMTFEPGGRTLNGTDPATAVITLQSLGATSVGCNCSTGPEDMLPSIELMKKYARVPLMAKPNAGMPKLVDGRTVFEMTPEEFAGWGEKLVHAGASICGGCCGTGPAHIKALSQKIKGMRPEKNDVRGISAVTSPTRTVFIGPEEPFRIIGERINPTGKKALQEELRNGEMGIVRQFALEQKSGGAALLDINMGLSGIDEKEMMLKAVTAVTKAVDLPVAIDTTVPEVAESALRLYPGRALVNSISAEKERLEKVLPVAAKYGAMFILLPLTDGGIPSDLKERIAVVREVIEAAKSYGYTLSDIVVDGLVMTVSSNQEAANVTLDCIDWCAGEMGLNTVCGLSNVSFGLPERKWINAAFLGMSMGRGMTMAIANPSSQLITGMVESGNALRGVK